MVEDYVMTRRNYYLYNIFFNNKKIFLFNICRIGFTMDRLQQKLTPKAGSSFGKKPSSQVVLGRNDPYLRRAVHGIKAGKINTLNALLENQFGTPRVPVNSVDGVDGMDGFGWVAPLLMLL